LNASSCSREIFTLESFNFIIFIFDQEIGICKHFQFLWSFRSGCFQAHLQNLKTNIFIKSLYPKTTKKVFGNVGKICFKNSFKTYEQKFDNNHSFIRNQKYHLLPLSIVTCSFKGHKIHCYFYFTIWSQSLLWQLQLYRNAYLIQFSFNFIVAYIDPNSSPPTCTSWVCGVHALEAQVHKCHILVN
jgi:hypothetical protein